VLETSQRTRAVAKALEAISSFFADSAWARRHKELDVCDFAFGNPQEWPLPELVEALRFHATPRSTDWFAYKANEQETCAVIADALGKKLGLPFEAEDIAVTNGAFSALVVAIHLLTDPGDEVLFSTPPWFCYEALIVNAGAVAAKVPVTIPSFDLDLEAIGRAITPHTRIVIVNSPHNPTGRVYSSEVLAGLAAILEAASRRNGHRIWLLSDECYREIVFDGLGFCSPASIYPYTLIAYSYAKKLLTPGQRIGYLAIAPTCPDRQQLRDALFPMQSACGWCFADALLQHSIREFEALSIDVGRLQRKRDRMVEALADIGYAVRKPVGTFYLLPRAPMADDIAFARSLADRDVFVVPGSICELPGYFRLSLTATEEMFERSLPIFAQAFADNEALATEAGAR
jgi:aspartate aminotransferase